MARMARKKPSLVGAIADRMRDMVFAAPENMLIGSLQDLAKSLEVGIVTVQQAARVLEHEGVLDVRRGPGGGYYGKRPTVADLERSITAFVRSNPTSYEEALDITSLLFTELAPAAADCRDAALRGELAELLHRLDGCVTEADYGVFENDFQNLLFQMVDRPLFKILTLVTLRVSISEGGPPILGDERAIGEWRSGRRRIIDAIIRGDRELARFEADRSNRRVVMRRVSKANPANA